MTPTDRVVRDGHEMHLPKVPPPAPSKPLAGQLGLVAPPTERAVFRVVIAYRKTGDQSHRALSHVGTSWHVYGDRSEPLRRSEAITIARGQAAKGVRVKVLDEDGAIEWTNEKEAKGAPCL
jgi:hypothetical protein